MLKEFVIMSLGNGLCFETVMLLVKVDAEEKGMIRS